MEKLPFKQKKNKEGVIRTFSKDLPENALKWHCDGEDRTVIPLNENDWKFQFDNKLPQSMDSDIFIPKGVYHRVIKGSTDLIIKILK